MPSLVLGLDATAIAASAIAGGGCIVGLKNWHLLNRSQRWTAAFLFAAALAGVLGDCVRKAGFHNAWVGNLWQLSLPGLLIPALIAAMPQSERSIYRAVQRVLVLLWLSYFLAMNHIQDFTAAYHACSCIATVLLALTLLFYMCRATPVLHRSPGFLLGVGAALSCACDVLPHAAYLTWALRGDSMLLYLWIFRNATWCAGFALMAYTLYLGGRREV